MTTETYPLQNLERTTYLTCGEETHRLFEEWVGGMVMDRDGEWGEDRLVDGATIPGFLTWTKEQNRTFTPDFSLDQSPCAPLEKLVYEMEQSGKRRYAEIHARLRAQLDRDWATHLQELRNLSGRGEQETPPQHYRSEWPIYEPASASSPARRTAASDDGTASGAEDQQKAASPVIVCGVLLDAPVTFSPLFQTFIWRDRETGEVVATATIAPDDRGVKAQYELGGDGLWGGVNVRPEHRGRGIGKFVCQQIDEHIQRHAQSVGSLMFHLFTANPVAEEIYKKLGFQRSPLGEIHTEAFAEERLWTKKYDA